jgi:hypothetical protein
MQNNQQIYDFFKTHEALEVLNKLLETMMKRNGGYPFCCINHPEFKLKREKVIEFITLEFGADDHLI